MWSTLSAIDPIAFQLGPIAVRWYSLTMVLAIAAGIYLSMWEARRLGLDPAFVEEAALWLVPAGIIGARLYEVFVLQWPYYRAHPWEIPAIWRGGLAIHGAIFAATIVGYLFMRAKKAPFLQWADIMMPSLLAGQAIGRWGNFFNQEAHGGAAPDWLAALMPEWFRSQMTIGGVVYHPTFLYESVWNLIGLVALLAWRRRNPPRGSIFFGYLIWYSLGRAVIESLRTDSSYLPGGWRTAQAVSLATLALAAIGWYLVARRVRERYAEPAGRLAGDLAGQPEPPAEAQNPGSQAGDQK